MKTTFGTSLIEALFDYDAERRLPQVAWWAIGLLYVMGAVTWAYFLGWASLPLNFGDWADINIPRLQFLGNAIASGELPLHMAYTHSLHGVSDRFFSLPDVITTPQTLLLPLIGVRRFVLLDVLLHYSIGVAGLLALRRRFRWSVFSFATVFLLFLFNGNILSHYSVGHFTWAAYFLYPLWFLFLFQFLDGGPGWRWVTRCAFVLFYMVLAGGQHHMTWALVFLGCLIPFFWDRAAWIVAAGAASGLLSAFRMLPPALSLDAFASTGWISDVIGYPSFFHLAESMVSLRREHVEAVSWPVLGNFVFYEVNYFEFNYYVGIVGALVVVYFGVYAWFRAKAPLYPQLMLPTLAVVAMSMGSVFRLVRASGIPLLMSERVVSRMLGLPMALIMIMVGVFLQKAIDEHRLSPWNRLTAIALLGLLAIDVSGEVRVMRAAETAKTMKIVALGDDVGAITRRVDPPYTATLGAGAAITTVTAAGLLVLARRERRLAASS